MIQHQDGYGVVHVPMAETYELPGNPRRLLSRFDFGVILNKLGLIGIAVEVGTHRGWFADSLLKTWKGQMLVCVDPWLAGYDEHDPVSYLDREDDMHTAANSLSKYVGRHELRREASPGAAEKFNDGVLDFVYIDGCHQYENVLADMTAWWPKVKVGGMFAGHDFAIPGSPAGWWDGRVQPAVIDFFQPRRLTIELTADPDGQPWSWFVVKPIEV